MSDQSRNVYKWAFVGLLIAVTLIGASLYVNWRFTELQVNFNKRVAANALSANAQIRVLEDETEDLAQRIERLEAGIRNLEFWIEEELEALKRVDVQLYNEIDRLDTRIGWIDTSYDRLWSYYYELDQRVDLLEAGPCSIDNCTYCNQCTFCGRCLECPAECCGDCMENSYSDRYGSYCSFCGAVYDRYYP